MWRVLLPYFKDPELLKAFMADSCATEDVAFPAATLYTSWTPRAQESGSLFQLSEVDAVRMCVDTGEALPKYMACAPALPPATD